MFDKTNLMLVIVTLLSPLHAKPIDEFSGIKVINLNSSGWSSEDQTGIADRLAWYIQQQLKFRYFTFPGEMTGLGPSWMQYLRMHINGFPLFVDIVCAIVSCSSWCTASSENIYP